MADTKEFYFKMFAREYLTSGEVRGLHLEAQGILPRLWCVCCLEGSIPADLEDLSLAAGVKLSALQTHMPALMQFFYAPADANADANASENASETHMRGRLYSRRMERERANRQKVSDGASKAAKAKWDKKKDAEKPPEPKAPKDANADANAYAAIVHSSEPHIKEGTNVPSTAPRKRAAPKKAPESLEEILQGGKGTVYWEAYWKLVSTFGGQPKNPAPKTTAALYMSAIVGFHPDHIQAKADAQRAGTSAPQYMPQLKNWLEGQGYATPDLPTATPHPSITGAPNGPRTHHRAATDAAGIRQLEEREARRAAQPVRIITDEEEQAMRAMLGG